MLLRFEYTASFTSILSMHACGCNSRSTLVVFLSPTRDKQYVSHPFFSETNFSYVFFCKTFVHLYALEISLTLAQNLKTET